MSISTFDLTPELLAPASSCPRGISTWGSDGLLQMKILHLPDLCPLLSVSVSASHLSKQHHHITQLLKSQTLRVTSLVA